MAKALILALVALLLPALAHAAYRTSTTGVSGDTGSVTTSTVATESGDLAVGMILTLQAAPINTCSDYYANTWTLQEKYSASVDSESVYLYVYTIPMTTYGSSETYTCSWTGDENYALLVEIHSGRNTSSPLDGTPGTFADTGYTQSHSGASVTTSDSGSDVVEFATDGTATATETFTAGSGYTIGPELLGTGSTYGAAMAQYDDSVSTGSHTGAWSTTNYVEGAAVIIALKESSASCTHEGITSAGALATPNGSSGSYQGNSGSFVTPNCSSIEYKQPTIGNFGVN